MVSNNWQTTAKLFHTKRFGLHLQQLIFRSRLFNQANTKKGPVGLDNMQAFPDHLNEKSN